MSLKGRTIFITGASRGIGNARGAFLVSKYAIAHLEKSANPQRFISS
jgi:short-subunit dehydrogenase